MIPFSKYSGAGNDFVVVNTADLAGVAPPALARSICPRASGVGVDGMALVEVDPGGEPATVALRFFNPDGSEFATCGNGSRCVARWAVDAGIARDGELELRTRKGTVRASVRGDGVLLDYEIEAWVEGARCVPYRGEEAEGWLVRMGTPHFVLPLDRLPGGPIGDLCRPIRHHPSLGAEGANVNLVEPGDGDRARIRTFERGVEAETRACGAGSMAATLALHAAGATGPALRLDTRGGRLEVRLAPDAAAADRPARRRVTLAGPARFVFEGRYPEPEAEAAGGEA